MLSRIATGCAVVALSMGALGVGISSADPLPTGSAGFQLPAWSPLAPAQPFYADCTAARAAHATPLLRGQPGYRPELDPDGDGVACEM